ATGQLENTMQISSVKRDIARALTVQTQANKKAAQK
ncbi:MAG: 50S ribosomal protein L29, partial [Clostridiales bacterium]|nr:50S ribosomal protein L29 [Clostridiales bacterium]